MTVSCKEKPGSQNFNESRAALISSSHYESVDEKTREETINDVKEKKRKRVESFESFLRKGKEDSPRLR